MKRCTRCVMPDSRPDVPFTDGVCQACLNHANRPTIDWKARKTALVDLLARHDGKCIVPSSGGKDSTFQVLALQQLGADVTVVTARTCHLTRIGRFNIDNLARYARTIEVTPNQSTRQKLNRLGLEQVGDISWPEHVAIFTTPFRMAVALDTPLIFYGENPQNQYGGPEGTVEAMNMTQRWVQEFGGFLGLRPTDMVGHYYITLKDMQDYLPPSAATIEHLGIEAHFLGQYIRWDSRGNAEIAEAAGMRADLPTPGNWWRAENLDNAQTGIHDYFGWLKYGYGRGCAQISVDIREGKISREAALEWVKVHDGLFPHSYAGVHFADVLESIRMTPEEFFKIARRFTNQDIFRLPGHGTHNLPTFVDLRCSP